MSELNVGQESLPPQPNPGTPPPRKPPTKPTLWEEIQRGWDWVVFVWQMGQRLGGWRGVIHTVSTVGNLLLSRLLTQLGLSKKS